MTFWIDAAVLAVIAFCAWRGFKSGLVRGIFGFAALIFSLIIANIVATAYSSEFQGMLKPFIDGIVETTLIDVVEENAEENAEESAEESANVGAGMPGGLEPEALETKKYDLAAAFATLREIGLPESSALRIAEDAVTAADEEDEGGGALWFLADTISDVLSSSLSFIALFAITFLLIAIIFAVIGNLVGLVFSLPGLKAVDMIAGALLGLAKGLAIVYVVASVLRYFGLFAHETIEGTSVLKFFINNNPIANMLGI